MARRKVIEWLIHRLENEVDDRHFSMQSWLLKAETANLGYPGYFDAVQYYSERDIPYCKTAACIAGTLFLGLPKELRNQYVKLANSTNAAATLGLGSKPWPADVELAAREQMGLTFDEASDLFAPSAIAFSKLTRRDAIAVLKRMLSHSVIDWKHVRPDEIREYVEPRKITFTD